MRIRCAMLVSFVVGTATAAQPIDPPTLDQSSMPFLATGPAGPSIFPGSTQSELTAQGLLTAPLFANPWRPAPNRSSRKPAVKYVLHGGVVHVYLEDGAISLHHDAVPGFMNAIQAPHSMEFLVPDNQSLVALKPGMKITAGVRKRGNDHILEQIRRTTKP